MQKISSVVGTVGKIMHIALHSQICNQILDKEDANEKDMSKKMHFDLHMYVSAQRCAVFRHLNFKKCSETVSFLRVSLANVRFATAACNFSTSQLQKVVRAWGVLYIWTYKCTFRHSGVQFLDISTSKSCPNLRCFVHFDLQMHVSPQRRAVFRHLHFKKCSETVSFLSFSLANVRFATAACNFSTSQLEKVVRAWGVLYILTYKCTFRHSGVQFLDIWTSKSAPRPSVFKIFTCECAFRHSGVQFFDISTWKSAPSMRCFVHFDLQMCVSPQRRAIFRHLNLKKCSEHEVFCTFWLTNVRFATAACNFCFLSKTLTSAPAALTGLLFDWPDPRIIEKTQHFATSLTFRACVSSFIFLYCIFCRLTWLLYCFSTLHIVGSFYLNFLW